MPEVCEIALTAQFLSKYKIIKNIKLINQKFKINNLNNTKFPLNIIEVDSYGKLMWFKVVDANENKFYITNTFGLFGFWTQDDGDVLFEMEENMFYNDKMRFGKIILMNEHEFNKKKKTLAPDFLRTEFTNDDFIKSFKDFVKKNKKREDILIVKLLMEQKKSSGIGSGLGNYLVSEILYASKISPKRLLKNLSNHRLSILAENIKFKTKLYYMNNNTKYIKNLSKFIKEHRKGVHKGIYPNFHPLIEIDENTDPSFIVYQQKEDDLGNEVVKENIITGRNTYWVPKIQI